MSGAAPDAWRVGDVVDDLYEVRQVMTSGGMGLVHRVWHRGWNLELAVKTPRPQLVSSPQQIADFETEAETWVSLGLHPHVVACVYVRRLAGLPRVFAEWVDGGSLSEAVESRGLYAGSPDAVLARILDIAIQFAWGLDHAHSRGLIHQDVKPANVMLTSDWTVKVSDFGLAKARAAAGEVIPSGPRASVLAGYGGMTPAYCSPEQARAAHAAKSGGHPPPLSRATDVWSWAISIWEMFTGEAPCRRGQVADETFRSFRDAPWVDDPAIPPMPDAIAVLLTRCLDPDVATRPRRIAALADELARLYQQLTGTPYPRTKPQAAELLADALNNQALSLLDLGRTDDAEQLWQQALAADPHHLDSIYNRGLHRWRCGHLADTELLAQLETMRAGQPGAHADHLLALVQLERYNTLGARRLLTDAARQAPEVRDITEALSAAQQQGELAEPRPLTGADTSTSFRAVSISADGRIAVTDGGDENTTVQVWDVVGGNCLRTLSASGLFSVAVSANGRYAVSGGGDTMQLWDMVTGACLHTWGASSVSSVAVSADGGIAVSASDDTVQVWDTAGGICLHTLTGKRRSVDSVAVSADGSIAISGGRAVRVWDVSGGACVHTLTGHDRMVGSVAVSADARIGVSGSYDRTVRVWDLAAGTCLRTLTGHTDAVFSVAVSADARIAVSGSYDNTVRVWDLAEGTCLRTLSGHTEGVRSVALSADGKTAVSGSRGQLWVWDVPTTRGHAAGWSYARPHSAHDLLAGAAAVEDAARRAETLLAAAGAGEGPLHGALNGAQAAAQLRTARAVPGYRRDRRLVALWRGLARLGVRARLQDAWPQYTLTGHASSVFAAVSGDGRIAVSGDRAGTLRVWDVGSGACLHTLTADADEVAAVAVSGDGRVAVSCGYGRTVQVWDVGSGVCLRTLTGHNSSVNSVALSADGRVAVSGSFGQTLRVWDVDSGACLRTLSGHTGRVRSVAVSADGRVAVSGSSDATLRAWDLRGGACLHTMAYHTNWVGSVALSANGRIAASATNGHERVRVWDLDRGACIRTLEDDADSVAVAVSADGRVAVTGGNATNKTVRVWDLLTKTCLCTLAGHTDAIRSIALSADATVAVTGSDDHTVRVWALDWEYGFGDAAARAETSGWPG